MDTLLPISLLIRSFFNWWFDIIFCFQNKSVKGTII